MKKFSRRGFTIGVLGFGAGLFLSRDVLGALDALDAALVKQELRVKTDAEGAFVDDVVAKTRSGEIPPNILNAAYRYAVKKDGGRRVYYFARCLEILTKRAGLNVKFLKF
ncbi:MAG: hypothetical protein J6K20_10875 [Thermoguttaceae bacterium]|nr:hypothetical protein [Thermoguttaceae bacterium]